MATDPAPRVFRPGAEVTPPQFTPPKTRAALPEWTPYRPPRFSRRTRVLLTVAIFAVPVLLVCAAVTVLLFEHGQDGRARAGAVILLMPVVPAVPLLLRAWRDLWGSGEQ